MKKTPKTIILWLSLLIVFSMSACSKTDSPPNDDNGTPPVQTPADGNGGQANPEPGDPSETAPPEEPSDKVLMENDAFRLFAPEPESEVAGSFTVKGEARVFEASFSYSLEDGHNILAEGHVTADKGAPDWGGFEFEVKFDKASSPNGILILYETSAKDGTPVNQLYVPVKFSEVVAIPEG